MEQLSVRILDRDYRLSCEPAERDTLLAAVAHVDATMQTIRGQGRIAGSERIAVFAALNIASALLASATASAAPANPPSSGPAESPAQAADGAEIQRRIESINALLDTALVDQERLF